MIKLDNLLRIEEKLISEFERIYIVLKNSKSIYFSDLKLEKFFFAFLKEESELCLDLLKNYELENLYDELAKEIYEDDSPTIFEEIFYSENLFESKVRLLYHLKLEKIKRLNAWDCFDDFFECRLMKAFCDLHEKNNFGMNEEYLKLYLKLMYTFPVLNLDGTIKYQTIYNANDYQRYEKSRLENTLIKLLKNLPKEKDFLFYHFLFTYFELALDYKDKKWLDQMILHSCFSEREKGILLRYTSVSLNQNILLLRRKK